MADWEHAGVVSDDVLTAGMGLVVRAEQALLGAILSDARQAAVLDLLRPADMVRPYHAQALAALQRLRAGGGAPDPLRLRDELAADPDLPPRIALDGVLIADLLEAAPQARHAPAYAAMIIESSIRRQLALAGSRIAQAAGAGDRDGARQLVAAASRAVRDCQQRWAALPGQMRREPPPPALGKSARAEEAAWQLAAAHDEIESASRDIQARDPGKVMQRLALIARHVAAAAAARQAADSAPSRRTGAVRPRGAAAEAAGEQLLRDLTAGPDQIPAVRAWLHPGHFARPARGQLYALIRDMHHGGLPVDPVAVSWEAARQGIPAGIADLSGGTAHFAVASAREVRRHGRLAQLAQAGRILAAIAADRRLTVGQLLRDSGDALRDPEQDLGMTAGPARRAPQPAVAPACPEARRAHETEPSPEAVA